MDLGLLVLRLVVGLTLATHGAQKLFGWFGGYGLAGTGGFMEQLGFRPGRRAALMAGLSETVGGLLLALGAATPLAAALIVGVMLVATFSVHWTKGFFNRNGGYEYPLVLATYEIVCSKGYDADTAAAVKSFLTVAANDGQGGLSDAGYVPLPDTFKERLLTSIDAIGSTA
jgi:putative oxidoreductase